MGMGGDPVRNCKPMPCADSEAATPSAAANPNTEPPASTTACARPTKFSGASASVSRVPGPPPRTSTAAAQPVSQSTAVMPLRTASFVALPTLSPAISVMRFLGPGRNTILEPSEAVPR